MTEHASDIPSAHRCGTCRHWKRNWWTSEEWEFGDRSGLCNAVAYTRGSEGDLRRIAWSISVGEGNAGDLATTAEFGCVLWAECVMTGDEEGNA